MILTSQQNIAMNSIKDFIVSSDANIFILKGYAGTGKTTLIAKIVEYLSDLSMSYQLMAPTGRAAKVLKDKVDGKEVTTIHRGIYEFSQIIQKEEDDSLLYVYPLRKVHDADICIVDEASMVSSRRSNSELFQFGSGIVLDDLMQYADVDFGGKIIFVGDPMQLPPVGDNHSCALDEKFFIDKGLSVKSYELTEIIRQHDESCILANSMKLREVLASEERNNLSFIRKKGEFDKMETDEVAEHYVSNLSKSSTSTVVCFSNQQVADYNQQIRGLLFPGQHHVVPGDKLMIVSNNYSSVCDLLNGEIVTVVDVSEKTLSQSAPVWIKHDDKKEKVNFKLDFRELTIQTKDGKIVNKLIFENLLENNLPSLSPDEIKALYINLSMRAKDSGINNPKSKEFRDFIMQDPFFNALQVKYGYAATCHKSQGGEWNTVYIDFRRRTGLDNDSLRWKYTALTRAKDSVYCMNLVDITPLSKLKVTDIVQTNKVSSEALSFGQINETGFHPSGVLEGVKAKYWSVFNNVQGSVYSIDHIESKPWREIYYFNAPEGVVRVDALYNKAGIFNQYIIENNDPELLRLFNDESNMEFNFDFNTNVPSLESLYNSIVALCDELNIIITNVVSANYAVVFYLRTSCNYASLTIYYDSKGFMKYAAPLSLIGKNDEKLHLLLDRLV